MVIALFAQACVVQGLDDPDRAAQGWRSTQNAMSDAGIHAAPSAVGLAAAGTVGPDGVSGAVTGTFDCDAGGTMVVAAAGDVTDDAVTGAVTVEFDECTVDDVTIDGTLEYEGYVGDARVSASIRGDVVWSGAVDGSCEIDVTAEVSASGITGGASLQGDVCGHAWSDLV